MRHARETIGHFLPAIFDRFQPVNGHPQTNTGYFHQNIDYLLKSSRIKIFYNFVSLFFHVRNGFTTGGALRIGRHTDKDTNVPSAIEANNR